MSRPQLRKGFGSCTLIYALEDDLEQVLISLIIWFLLDYDIEEFC